MQGTARRARGGLLPLIAMAASVAAALCVGTLLGMRLTDSAPLRATLPRAGAAPASPYVALCLSVKNEWADLPEWVEHHLGLGVGKIYVMDQASSPPLSTVLGRHIASGAVEYEWLAGVPPPPPPPSPGVQPLWDFSYNGGRFFQLYAYDRCLELHRQKHTWMGFIDADEFIILRPDIPSLPALLRRYEAYGGLALFWKLFGSSGHRARPPGGVRASYLHCAPPRQEEHVKTLFNLRDVLPTLSNSGPHNWRTRPGAPTVNTKGVPVPEYASAHHAYDEAYIHHYVVKSWEDYQAKMARGNGMTDPKPPEFFEYTDRTANLTCPEALRYVHAAASTATLH